MSRSRYDFYAGSNNINGINASAPEEWVDPDHPVFAVQKALVVKAVHELGHHANVIWEVANEPSEHNGKWAAWVAELAEAITAAEESLGLARHLVIPRDIPGHQSTPGHWNDKVTTVHAELVALWAASPNITSGAQPVLADNDCCDPPSALYARHRAWAALTAGAQSSFLNVSIRNAETLTAVPARAGMNAVGSVGQFVNNAALNVNLRGMSPADHLISSGWCLSRKGEEYIIYLIAGGVTSLRAGVMEPHQEFTSRWFNPRNCTTSEERPGHADSSGGAQFSAPDDFDWVLYLTTPNSSYFTVVTDVYGDAGQTVLTPAAACLGIEEGVCFPQNELSVVPGVNTTAACCAACQADKKCTAFTMNHDGKPNDAFTSLGPRCSLKACDPTNTSSPPCNRVKANCTSGRGYPPAPPGPPSLNGHIITLDEKGVIESWLPADTALSDLMERSYSWLINTPAPLWIQPSGLPTYMLYSKFPPSHNPSNPGSLFAVWAEFASLYYPYTGNRSVIEHSEWMLKYMLRNGTTPAASSWKWGSVPYASAEPGDVKYSGFADNGTGTGDGFQVIESDKVGGVGWAYLTIWKVTQSPELLAGAIACADALAANVEPGNATASPWPFRVHAQTGEVQEPYTANVIWCTRLFDALLALPPSHALAPAKTAAYRRAREMAWHWQQDFPMNNGNWCGYHEDIYTRDAWHNGTVGDLPCNYNSMTPLLLARHLLQQPSVDDATMANARTLLTFVETHLIFWSVGDQGPPASKQPAVAWGARCVSEQKVDRDRMGRHTTRYASVLALYANVLLQRSPGNATALAESQRLVSLAWASWNWAGYCMNDVGIISVTPSNGEHDAWFSQTTGFLLNTMEAVAAWPAFAPPNETHFLGSDSVVTSIKYVAGGNHATCGQELVRWSVFSGPTRDWIRVAQPILIGSFCELSVEVDGQQLPRREDCKEASGCSEWWDLQNSTGILAVWHAGNGEVVVAVAAC